MVLIGMFLYLQFCWTKGFDMQCRDQMIIYLIVFSAKKRDTWNLPRHYAQQCILDAFANSDASCTSLHHFTHIHIILKEPYLKYIWQGVGLIFQILSGGKFYQKIRNLSIILITRLYIRFTYVRFRICTWTAQTILICQFMAIQIRGLKVLMPQSAKQHLNITVMTSQRHLLLGLTNLSSWFFFINKISLIIVLNNPQIITTVLPMLCLLENLMTISSEGMLCCISQIVHFKRNDMGVSCLNHL